MRKHAELYRPKSGGPPTAREIEEKLRQRLAAADPRARDVLMLSHGHCLDGTGSGIVAQRAFGADRVGIAFIQPGDMANVLEMVGELEAKGRRLLIADLSLNPDQFDDVVAHVAHLAGKGWRIDWLDHHHKQWEGLELDRLTQYLDSLVVNADATESGASLVQKAFCPKDTFAKRLADTVKDRDLWLNKDPDSEILEFAITWMGESDFAQHMLPKKAKDPVVDATIRDAARRQKALIEEHTQVLLEEAQYYDTTEGDRVGVVYGWLPKNVGLHRLLQQDRVRVAINVRPNGKVSLRSRKDAPVTHLVARRFDGGGHPNASGADLGLKGIRYRWYLLRHGKVRRTQEMAEAAVHELEVLEDQA